MKRVAIVSTGGTIAGKIEDSVGYTSAKLNAKDLIDSVKGIDKLAEIEIYEVSNVGSQNMSIDIWLKLAKTINHLLNKNSIDGVVVTHGTDTMSESAYFLNLVIDSEKPVVITGSMRPSDYLSADGPSNLYNAVVVATSQKAVNRGVLVVMNEKILDARGANKTHTMSVESFESSTYGSVGYVVRDEARFARTVSAIHTKSSEFRVDSLDTIPTVEIVADYVDPNPIALNALVDSNVIDGLVVLGVGNGNFNKNFLDGLNRAVAKGIVVVIASRVIKGSVIENAEFNHLAHNFIVSSSLDAYKARILLSLALINSKEYTYLRDVFTKY